MYRRKPFIRALGAAMALSLSLGGQLAHADSADALAEKLAKLRGEVEGLSERLAEAKTDARNELQGLARQKADLQLELDREEVHLAKLRSVLQEKRQKIQDSSERGDDLAPVFDLGVKAIRGYVSQSLPFRRAERLGEIDKIVEQRQSGVLTYGKALVRLWSFIEDELRMARESATFQQTITLGKDETLAQVVRVGMVMLFFQTSDGKTGYSKKSDAGWSFVSAEDKEESKQIAALFDSFKKQIRVGLFTVPNALPAVEK